MQVSHMITNGDILNYQWRLTASPLNSLTTLGTPDTIFTDITLDQPGQYIAELTVNDGDLSSAPDYLTIDTLNSAPVAQPGNNQTAEIGQQVILDGSASYDVDGDSLNYSWAMLNKPANSSASLVNADLEQSYFTPDIEGIYIIQLITHDGQILSAPVTTTVTITVSVSNQNPVIDSTPVQSAAINKPYRYSLLAEDPDGDNLNYLLTASPAGMTIDASGQVSWIPEAAGVYAVTIQVTDNRGGQASQSYLITVNQQTLPPDPKDIAPALNPSEFTSLVDATAFIYKGENPI